VSLLKIDTNAFGIAAGVENLSEQLMAQYYGPARDAFRDVRDLLMENVRSNWLAGGFTPNTEVTTAYKQRKGLDSRTLFASGSSFAGIDGYSGATWARAARGETEWWMFLHDKGAGYGPWSREGWGRTKAGERKAGWKRRHRKADENPAVAGVTKFPARPVFFITGGTEEAVLSRIDLFLQSACDEVSSGAA